MTRGAKGLAEKGSLVGGGKGEESCVTMCSMCRIVVSFTRLCPLGIGFGFIRFTLLTVVLFGLCVVLLTGGTWACSAFRVTHGNVLLPQSAGLRVY